MRPEDYPAQEPFTAIGAKYHEQVMQRGGSLSGHEVRHGADPYQSLSVFRAGDPDGAVLCLMHGGGWTNGYKEWMHFMAPALTANGVTVVSLGYRLAPQHLYPLGFEDCLDGVAWVHANIAEFGGDPRRLFVCGHSAGGHYAALMALREDWQAPRGLATDAIRGALPISGTYRFGADSGLSMRPRFLGEPDNGADEAASPMRYVHAGAPPFLLAWGSEDFPHLVRQAGEFADALRAAGVSVATVEMPGCDHLGASYASGEADGPWLRPALDFLRDSR